jgi:hypothetical protein
MAVTYGVYFTLNGRVYRMPINPEELRIENPGETEDYNVIGIGPVVQQRSPGLRKCTLESYWPGSADQPGVLTYSDFREPRFYIEFFRKAMQDKSILLFTPVRYDEQGNEYGPSEPGFYVVVKNFEYEERGGETKDFYYTLELVEYKDFSPKRVKTGLDAAIARAELEPTRQTPPDEIVVGSKVYASGALNTRPDGNGQWSVILKSQGIMKVVYIADISKNRYPYRIANQYGEEIGWAEKKVLTVVS